MAKIDFLTAKMNKSRNLNIDFFDNLCGPPVGLFFRPDEVEYIRRLITRTNRNDVKINTLNAIMKSKGFSRLSGGTNRMVYRHLDDTSFVLKVALDRVGLGDNLAEFKNQQRLKPYVCKIFDTTPCGTMATIERVIPITSKEEFIAVQEEVFYLIVTKIIGKYVAEDIGRNYFRNFGIRPMFGPVLLDYPYIYPLAEEKLFCTYKDPVSNIRCTGMIDYDDGFNHLFCRKCGTRYLAVDLEDKNAANDIIKYKGGIPMNVTVYMNGEKFSTMASSKTISERIAKKITSPTEKEKPKLKVSISGIKEATEEVKNEVTENEVVQVQVIGPVLGEETVNEETHINDNLGSTEVTQTLPEEDNDESSSSTDSEVVCNEETTDNKVDTPEEVESEDNDSNDNEDNDPSNYRRASNGSWIDTRTGNFISKSKVPANVIEYYNSINKNSSSKTIKTGTSMKSRKSRVYSSPGASVEE